MLRLRYIKVTNVTFKQKVAGPGYRAGHVSQSVHWSEVGEERSLAINDHQEGQTDILAAGSGQLAISAADKRPGWLLRETKYIFSSPYTPTLN